MNVLIIEDDTYVTRLLKDTIRRAGHDVTDCLDAESALAHYQTTFYPLIISDIGLPGIDGVGFIRRVREMPNGKYSFIVVSTGVAPPSELAFLLEAGADDYITKPLNLDILKIRLEIAYAQAQHRIRQKKTDEDIQQALTHLEEMNREKIEIFNMVSHDLKGPLTFILGIVDFVSHSSPEEFSKAKLYRYFSDIQKNGQRMFQLMDRLLNVNNLETGRINLNYEVFDICFPLLQVIEIYTHDALKKQIQIDFQPPPDEFLVYADESAVQQILENLISNAIKYSPPHTQISISLKAHNEYIICKVQDEGQGFDAHEKDLIFHKFVRLHPVVEETRHSAGLGLAIVKRLAELMGGRVWAESPGRGNGSTFFVQLPKSHAPQSSVTAASHS
ncbi:MAG: response regulator [Gemmatimonadetes bacterium]|nr:MAG: response regulator [Gemmatimonadota bacterium]